MFPRLLRVREEAGRFDHDINAKRRPINLTGIPLFEYFDRLAIDADAVFGRLYVGFQVAQNRVILQKVRESLRIRNVVHGYKFKVLIADRCPVEIAANASKAVDSYFNRHNCSSP
jgi:hypothetical protein